MSEPAAAKIPKLEHPRGAHVTPPDTRAQMAEAIRAANGGAPLASPQASPAAPVVPPAGAAPSPAAFPPPQPAFPSAADLQAQNAQQALADVIPLFQLPGSPEGSLAPVEESSPPGDEIVTAPPSPSTRLDPQRLEQIDQWVSNLSPRELLILDGAMTGDIDGRLAAALITGQPFDAPAPPAAGPDPAPVEQFDPNAYADPDLAAYVKQRLDGIESATARAEEMSRAAIEADRAQLQRQHADALNAAAARFGDRHGLDANAVLGVANMADQLGIIGGLMAQAGNAPLDAVYERALELGFRTDDSTFNAHVEKLATERAKELTRTQREADEKSRNRTMKDNASTVTAIASRDLPKTPEPVDPRMLNDEQRTQAIAALVRQHRGRN